MNENVMILSEADTISVALTDRSAGETHPGCWQTNANQSTKGRRACCLPAGTDNGDDLECPPFHRTAWLGLSADLNSTGERMASAECGWTVL